jgi:hypothetical protein
MSMLISRGAFRFRRVLRQRALAPFSSCLSVDCALMAELDSWKRSQGHQHFFVASRCKLSLCKTLRGGKGSCLFCWKGDATAANSSFVMSMIVLCFLRTHLRYWRQVSQRRQSSFNSPWITTEQCRTNQNLNIPSTRSALIRFLSVRATKANPSLAVRESL